MPDGPPHLTERPKGYRELVVELRIIGSTAASHLEQPVGAAGRLVCPVLVPCPQARVGQAHERLHS